MPRKDSSALIEAGLETSEVIVDVLSNGAIWADVPVIGTALKLCHAADEVRQALFAAKLARFIVNLNEATDREKAAIRARVKKSRQEASKVGETLILVLEQVTDMDKPAMLARLFISYADNVLSDVELRRSCQAVNLSFADDLRTFLEASVDDRSAPWMEAISPAGLSRPAGGTTYDTDGEIYYNPTSLGAALRRAHAHKPLF
jgi:hypothetical protein